MKKIDNPLKRIDTSDLDAEQQEMLKDIVKKELIKKIERRISNNEGDIMKTLKVMLEDDDLPRRRKK